jgi:enoyl-CoA hydratase/carnithine racemase
MTQDEVLREVENGIATITLNRPDKHNAVTSTSEQELIDHLRWSDTDDRVRAIVLTAAGPSFCVGGDRSWLESVAADDGGAAAIEYPDELFGAGVRKPVVAAINGRCAGVGMVYALTADIRFAARSAVFTTAFVRRGLAGGRGLAWYLTQVLGHARALDLLLSGRVVSAEEAERIGLVHEVVDDDKLQARARDWARDVADNCSPSAMAVAKRQVYDASTDSIAAVLGRLVDDQGDLISSPDFREGIASLIEHRPPSFRALGPITR